MRNDSNLLARSPGGPRSSFLRSSFREISTYLRSVSANASNIASSVRSASVLPVPSGALPEDERQREQVQWAGFDRLELSSGESRHVLLLTYLNGFQLWDLEEATNVRELVSRRDGPVSFLRLQPRPYCQESADGGIFDASRPLLLVITADAANTGSLSPGGFPGVYSTGGVGSPPASTSPQLTPTIIRFYSLQSHSYVHVVRFRTGIYAVRCSPRVVVVALFNQIYCLDAASLQNTFSVLTYPAPPSSLGVGFGAMAVGPRWLAYAANQPLITSTGRVSPQHLTPSPGISPSTSPANSSLVREFAKESSKQLAAGIVTIGDMGYKTVLKYWSEFLPDGSSSPNTGSPSWKNSSGGQTAWQGSAPHEAPEYAGMVIVRDFVSKSIVAQFRAHTSPISALTFDPSGTLLVTASIYGHNLNVFRLTPSTAPNGVSTTGFEGHMSCVHLYKLYRGLTHAVIQDISFSSDSQWVAVSTPRGTSHMFAISPFGGSVGPQTHGAIPVDGLTSSTLMPAPSFPWWSSPGPVRVSQQPLPQPPPPVTLSVVSRVKNAVGGWRNTVTGAAAAATGRSSNASGAIAATFHDGGNQNLEVDVGSGCLKEQLWVLSASGHLFRYFLRPSSGIEGAYSSSSTAGGNYVHSGSPNQTQELRLLIEPLEKWDVSRRPNWVEREDRVESLATPDNGYEEANLTGIGGQWGGPGNHLTGIGNGGSGKEGMSVDDMQRWYMSNAEVQMHNQARPLPIWARSKVYFHVMLPNETDDENILTQDSSGGEIEIERISTRVVEVRRKDLVPVIEGLQVFSKVQGARGVISGAAATVSSLDMRQLVDESLQEGASDPDFETHIHRTSSGSSLGSEGGLGGAIMNGYHYNIQDLPGISATGTPSSFESSQSFLHHSQRSGVPSALGRTNYQGTLFSHKQMSADVHSAKSSQPVSRSEAGALVIRSPPVGVPWHTGKEIENLRAPDVKFNRDEVNGASGTNVHFAIRATAQLRQSPSVIPDEKALVTRENSTEPPDRGPTLEIGMVAEGDRNVAAVFDQISLEDLETRQSVDSPIPSSSNRWELDIDGRGVVPLGQLSSGDNSTRGSGEGPAFLFDPERLEVGQGSNGSFRTQENGVGEDADSLDGHSKSEDNEGVDPGDDVWEGGMFPFCEEDC